MSDNKHQPEVEQGAEQEPLTVDMNAEPEVEGELLQADAAEVAALELQLAAANERAQSEKDQALRALAEMENLRRRAAQDVEKAQKFALEKFAGDLLPVIDSLERALEHTDKENEAFKAIYEGVDLTLKSLLTTIEKYGVLLIDPQGTPFDPNKHEAMSMVESADVPPNSVVAVMMKGYELNGRVLRPAMVMVAKGPAIDTKA
ncbi:nucleotide exchange factor GrpE [Oceanisphaera profunda]|uniref:Protein GrpE n=1 Tax=Oceanisphaera profunda TaxID=1416627 RepID=A0A1Y0D7J8_9GAMM|nr:nucleotide exchange factor GrpE [Oceanisphaera profunda]ART83519.1 nucleotide exchange factor GrpE [Oceanisphaera profunda]